MRVDGLARAKGDNTAVSFFVRSLVRMFVCGLGMLVAVLAAFVSHLGVFLRRLMLA
jgi:hypothetical protein